MIMYVCVKCLIKILCHGPSGKKIADNLKELLFDSPFSHDMALFTQVVITTVFVLFCVCFSIELYMVI